MGKFASAEPRRNQLAELLRPIMGRVVRVVVQLEPDAAASAPPAPAAPIVKQRPDAEAAPVPSAARPSPPAKALDRQAALSLPAVKQVMDVFDATLIDVQSQDGPASPAPSAPPRAHDAVDDQAPPTLDHPAPEGEQEFSDDVDV